MPEKVFVIDFHGRGLAEISSLEAFVAIRTLKLGFNSIKEIEGLATNTRLKELRLQSNKLTRVSGLEK